MEVVLTPAAPSRAVIAELAGARRPQRAGHAARWRPARRAAAARRRSARRTSRSSRRRAASSGSARPSARSCSASATSRAASARCSRARVRGDRVRRRRDRRDRRGARRGRARLDRVVRCRARSSARSAASARDDHVLIVTRDHAIDQKLLEALIARDDARLPRDDRQPRQGRPVPEAARGQGLLDGEAGEARWARLRAPIGLDIGAETPEEIAVAIAAELVARRRRGVDRRRATWASSAERAPHEARRR